MPRPVTLVYLPGQQVADRPAAHLPDRGAPRRITPSIRMPVRAIKAQAWDARCAVLPGPPRFVPLVLLLLHLGSKLPRHTRAGLTLHRPSAQAERDTASPACWPTWPPSASTTSSPPIPPCPPSSSSPPPPAATPGPRPARRQPPPRGRVVSSPPRTTPRPQVNGHTHESPGGTRSSSVIRADVTLCITIGRGLAGRSGHHDQLCPD